MTRISGEIRINAQKSKVWAAIADLGAVQDFNPSVTKSYYNTGPREGVGSSRHCDLVTGGAVEETVIDWEDGSGFTFRMHDFIKGPPFKTAQGRMTVREDGDSTVAGLTIEYRVKFGPIGAIMDHFMIRPQFEKLVPRVLQGLKRHLEAGAEAT